ncbi:unnamed protein product [Protopolystoma xenopodis]|uniref:Uncharacterized protein n=1 Tax=Protopolystoma xenopodis TaxID=117903 RepID=A0A448WBF1_9PLAT|nr:unnamed protein product [Protopolystoma xenopodis]
MYQCYSSEDTDLAEKRASLSYYKRKYEPETRVWSKRLSVFPDKDDSKRRQIMFPRNNAWTKRASLSYYKRDDLPDWLQDNDSTY